MHKPTSVCRQEFKEKIADAINTSELPAFIIEDVLSLFLKEIESIAQKQYETDLAVWTEKKE